MNSMADRNAGVEDARLAALHRHEVLDTSRVARPARTILQMPIVGVSLLDDLQWFKSRQA
jgi:hypothetical protein